MPFCSLSLLAAGQMPSMGWIAPFVIILVCIATLPLIPRTSHWWEHNRNKLILGLILGLATLLHYQSRGFGTMLHDATLVKAMHHLGLEVEEHHDEHGGVHHVSAAGAAALVGAMGNAFFEYVPFIVLLFSLYSISGGIAVRGDIPAHPLTNTIILGIGGVLASFVGTTGASMLLIRPLLHTNSERKRVAHTVIFFIFIVSNIGGCLLPIGDPPLFLGYLRGVPFLWTLGLWKEWAFMLIVLLCVYYAWDTWAYRHERPLDLVRDETQVQRIQLGGKINLLWLLLVVLAVALLDPAKPVPGTDWTPPPFLREGIQLLLVGLSFLTTPGGLRSENKFNFHAIAEVACLFIGIFITMQVPIEILNLRGAELGLSKPWQFFWATGTLSSFLDNAPTYVVFFQTANSLTHAAGEGITPLLDGNFIRQDLLVAISLGAVFMGANTYIGNGPNFMVKSIAEQSGVKMPSFFGYMIYSVGILVPLFIIVTLLFI
ncbi:MAG: sodium:proton antiporter [Phycisphaerae bacterium]|nr:sodium:proton antiporter [Phycisphaerae bacterium]NUQ47324.1 sodium:proton antiporter [Phycisphaerae bacterium]